MLIFVIAIILILATYFIWKTSSVSRKMNSQEKTQTTLSQSVRALADTIVPANEMDLKGKEDGRINILLLGAAGQNKPGGNLTDTVMIMSIDTESKKVALLSLPRDFYAPIITTADVNEKSSIEKIRISNSFAKINSLYPIGIKEGQGVELVRNAVQEITGLKLNYYVVVDFDGFEKMIDHIGGVNIVSERDIYDPTYPGPNYSYQTFSLAKGFHNLDGATALKYVRERHDDPEGDFGRAKRQQQVIQAVKNKLFSMKTIFNVIAINNILDTLGENIKTDITIKDLESFITLSKIVDLQNIDNVVVDAWKKESLLKVSHIPTKNGNAFILIPRVGNYSEIQEVTENIFHQDEIKKRRQLMTDENASLAIINKSGDHNLADKIRLLLLERLNFKNVRVIANSAESASIQTQTTVSQIENGNKIFTLDELIKKIPAKLSIENPMNQEDASDDIVITLGSDLIETYKYDEDSIEEFNKAQNTQEEI